jgi:hypothetical protein
VEGASAEREDACGGECGGGEKLAAFNGQHGRKKWYVLR